MDKAKYSDIDFNVSSYLLAGCFGEDGKDAELNCDTCIHRLYLALEELDSDNPMGYECLGVFNYATIGDK